MLRIKDNPIKKPAKDCTFATPDLLKQYGIDMLIALNMTPRIALTGPEVSIDSKILVTKEKPHFLFNPKSLQSEQNNSTIHITYKTYLGETRQVTLTDNGSIAQAIDHLNNGIQRANHKKV